MAVFHSEALAAVELNAPFTHAANTTVGMALTLGPGGLVATRRRR